MSTHKKNLSEPHFTDVCQGRKTIEGGLLKGIYLNLKGGDFIIFSGENSKNVTVKVIGIRYYYSLLEYLLEEGLARTLPSLEDRTIGDALKVYRKYYSEEDELEYGKVIAVEFIKV